MLNAKAFANAMSVVMAVWVLGCLALSLIVPDLLFSVAQSWMHTINLSVVKTTFNFDLGSVILGLITAVGLTWVTTYATIWFYNRLSR